MLLWNSATHEASAAETARNLLRTATTLALHLERVPGLVAVGGHCGDSAGRLLVPTSADDAVLAAVRRTPGVAARAVLTDVAALPVRQRWRGRLELAGRLSEVPADDAAALWQRATGGRSLEPDRRVLALDPQSGT